jgi:hypothetical protein
MMSQLYRKHVVHLKGNIENVLCFQASPSIIHRTQRSSQKVA